MAEVHRQGVGAEVVWASAAPFFMLKPRLARAFHLQNDLVAHEMSAACTRTGIDLNAARMLALGCGSGGDIYAYRNRSRHPRVTYAVDSATTMIDLFGRQFCEEHLLDEYLNESLVSFGGVPPDVRQELMERREYFANTHHKILLIRKDGWELSPEELGGRVDVIHANQLAHWMISGRKTETREFFRKMRELISPGGVMVLGESSDFVALSDSDLDCKLVKSGLASHPVYYWMHEEFHVLLAARGIDHVLPKPGNPRNIMFTEDGVAKTEGSGHPEGFRLLSFKQKELEHPDDPVEAFADRAWMYLGAHSPEKLPFDERKAVIEEAANRVREKYQHDSRLHMPLREQFFVMSFQAFAA